MCLLSVCSLHNVYMVYLTCLHCFPQGDIGMTGPPGIPGPPVSEIFFFPIIYPVIFLLDQSSVLFKAAAGERSMLFQSVHRIAAIKAEAP